MSIGETFCFNKKGNAPLCLLHAFWLQWCGNNTNTFEAFVAARMGFVPHVDEQPLPRVPSSYAPRVDVDDVRRKLREGEALEKERQRELLEVVAIEAAYVKGAKDAGILK